MILKMLSRKSAKEREAIESFKPQFESFYSHRWFWFVQVKIDSQRCDIQSGN